jgi:uncharacterized protein GlcG (DUF336 family)
VKKIALAMIFAVAATPVLALENNACSVPAAIVTALQNALPTVVTSGTASKAGTSLFQPNRMWLAIVDRTGVICSVTSTGDVWPGSRAIAIAKAETANDFSNSALALSTANLYGPTQPGGSLYGLNNSNPFNPGYLAQGSLDQTASPSVGTGPLSTKVPGGIITFGGGFPIYQGKTVIGGIGISGDTSCADNAVAFEVRALASRTVGNLDPKNNSVGTVGANGTDNIVYYPLGDTAPLNKADPSEFAQPHCLGATDPWGSTAGFTAKD